MTTTYDYSYGDIEYSIGIDGDDVWLEDVYTDLVIPVEDLYFVPKDNLLKPNGEPNMVSLADYLKDLAYDSFLSEWGSEESLGDANYADDKYDDSKYED